MGPCSQVSDPPERTNPWPNPRHHHDATIHGENPVRTPANNENVHQGKGGGKLDRHHTPDPVWSGEGSFPNPVSPQPIHAPPPRDHLTSRLPWRDIVPRWRQPLMRCTEVGPFYTTRTPRPRGLQAPRALRDSTRSITSTPSSSASRALTKNRLLSKSQSTVQKLIPPTEHRSARVRSWNGLFGMCSWTGFTQALG